ncbi:uncharacterized protein V1516DRAFT_614754, partial [Lipomyces oligophaga]|uniref:uncharacterized protein n=1 Tax=Lipomyces oligophaga TaxID=45792 RepID=UPI0034CFF580
MKFVALISGGKDSCFNIMNCQWNGHELAALANLHPVKPENSASDDGDVIHELDSFMYQTVGHTALPLYAQCFGVPIYRGSITGSAISSALDYSTTELDETEDLFLLLKGIKQAHPDISGVSVGAILSTYQRTRVESVCARLGLTVLAYLWQRNQVDLLNEMIDAGLVAVLIKVAGAGLSAKDHLGKTLAQVKPSLWKLHELYGSHVCGEGGEYETLVLDCPAFKYGRLVIDETQLVQEEGTGVAYLKVLNAHVEVKPILAEGYACKSAIPLLFDSNGIKLLKQWEILSHPDIPLMDFCQYEPLKFNSQVIKLGRWIIASNFTIHGRHCLTIEEEITSLFDDLSNSMSAEDDSSICQRIAFVSLILKDMTEFGGANSAYKEWFAKTTNGRPNPPARACISAGVPDHCRAVVSVVAQRNETGNHRRGLHVQGRSYWAPANIGPYAQAIQEEDLIFLAGQIGLVPPTMQVCKTVVGQSVLALQHLKRVATAVTGSVEEEGSAELLYIVGIASNIEAAATADWIRQTSKVAGGAGFTVQVEGLPAGSEVEYVGVAADRRWAEAKQAEDDERE